MSLQDRPLRADAERNRLRILQAARVLFAERGLDVSLDDVARAAGVGVGTVYRRFRDREELVAALLEKRMDELLAALDTAAASADPAAGLTAWLERSIEMQAEDRALKEILHSTADGRERVTEFRARMTPKVEDLLERAKSAGAVRDDIALTDLAMVNLMVSATADFLHPVDPDAWRRHLRLVLDGLRPGGTPLPKPIDRDQLEEAMECWRPNRR